MTSQQLSRRTRCTRARTRAIVTVGALTLALLLGAGGYVAVAANAQAPTPTVELSDDVTAPFTADTAGAQALVDAHALPTAIGWSHTNEVWTNDDTAYPLGSITKLITILVAMDHKPLEAGADGETYTWTAADAARTDEYLAVDGVAYSIPVGTELTQRQMLQFIFLPSANDFAYAYALWVFGSNEAFLGALEEWKVKHDLTSISFVEPTGMEMEDQASAADLVRVAQLALDNPAIREFNGTVTAEMPWGVGTIENSNPLLGVMPGVIGTKTGTLHAFGYNLIASQEADAAGRPVTKISVTLGRPSAADRAASGRNVLTAMDELPQQVELVTAGEEVGTATTADGVRVALHTADSVAAVMLPGEDASYELDVDFGEASEAEAGSEVGVLRVSSPSGAHEVPVVTADAVSEPDLAWRLLNPGLLFD